MPLSLLFSQNPNNSPTNFHTLFLSQQLNKPNHTSKQQNNLHSTLSFSFQSLTLQNNLKTPSPQIPIFLFFYFPHFPTTQTQYKLIFMSLLDELLDLATTELLLYFSRFSCLKAAATVEVRDDGGMGRKTVTTMVA